MIVHIIPLILTFNEELNIERVLNHLIDFKCVVVIDSFSNDKTIELLSCFPNVIFYRRQFDNHTNQWNYGISKISADWVLSLDADYIITTDLKQELYSLDLFKTKYDAFSISFKYCINGKPLRGTILPPRVALFNKNKSIYIQDGHTQMLRTNGDIGVLRNPLLHDDRKSLDHWLWAQNRYADLERDKLLDTEKKNLSFADKIRSKVFFAPFIILLYCLVLKGCLLDGRKGWYYAFQRMYFEILLSLKLLEAKQ